ncbi:MAG: hypothetical protein LBO76_00940 [Treponema sp.]|jgi:hypothetical protein|nr:hypothetical protein [Treponema sp.]
MTYILLSEHYWFNSTFSKVILALALTALLFLLIHATYHLKVQLYFYAKFGIKTTRAEAKYLEPLLGTFVAAFVEKWYPLNELWDVPFEKRKEALFDAASRILGCSYDTMREM